MSCCVPPFAWGRWTEYFIRPFLVLIAESQMWTFRQSLSCIMYHVRYTCSTDWSLWSDQRCETPPTRTSEALTSVKECAKRFATPVQVSASQIPG